MDFDDSSSSDDDILPVSLNKKTKRTCRGIDLSLDDDIEIPKETPYSSIGSNYMKMKENLNFEKLKEMETEIKDQENGDPEEEEKKYVTKKHRKTRDSESSPTTRVTRSAEKRNRRTKSRLDLSDDGSRSRSPSPTPVLSKRKQRANKKLFKKLEDAELKFITSEVVDCYRESVNRSVNIVEEGDELVISPNDPISVKIHWDNRLIRLPMTMGQTFEATGEEIRKECNIPVAKKIVLTLEDKIITFGSSPQSLNLTAADILYCYAVDKEEGGNSEEANPPNKDIISIKIQGPNSKNKAEISFNKTQPFSALREEYAKIINVKPALLKFQFDGDNVDLDETPADLDMEDGDCLDAKSK